jgi:hypothetical protein
MSLTAAAAGAVFVHKRVAAGLMLQTEEESDSLLTCLCLDSVLTLHGSVAADVIGTS